MVRGGCSDSRCEDCAAEWGRPVIIEGKLHAFQEMCSESHGMFIDTNTPETLYREKVCAVCEARWNNFESRPEPEVHFTYFVGDQYIEGTKIFHEPMNLRDYPITETQKGYYPDYLVEGIRDSNSKNNICFNEGHSWVLKESYIQDYYESLVAFEIGDFVEVFDKENPKRRIFSIHITEEEPMNLIDKDYFYSGYPARLTRGV